MVFRKCVTYEEIYHCPFFEMMADRAEIHLAILKFLPIYDIIKKHRRTVRRSVEDRKFLLAGRLSDKMSSELGCVFTLPGIFCF